MEQTTLLDDLVVISTLRRSAITSRDALEEERQAVVLARRAGYSWDRIGRELHQPGETLRRHHGQDRGAAAPARTPAHARTSRRL